MTSEAIPCPSCEGSGSVRRFKGGLNRDAKDCPTCLGHCMVIQRDIGNGMKEIAPMDSPPDNLASSRVALAAIDEEIICADGFDEAIIGWTDSWTGKSRVPRSVYSVSKCVSILMDGGSSFEHALEYLEFNTFGAYVGERSPIFVYDLEE